MSDWQYVDRQRLTELLVERYEITTTQVDEAFVESQRDWRDREIYRLELICRAQAKKLEEFGVTTVEIYVES